MNPFEQNLASNTANTVVEERMSIAWVMKVLRRRWALVLVPLAAFVAISIVVTSVTQPLYRASAEVLIRTEESANLFPLSESTMLLRSPSAEEGFLGSTEFESRAQATAGADNTAIIDVGDVSSRVKPSFVTFTVTDPNPQTAATVAQAWADTYIAMRHERDQSEISNTVATLSVSRSALDLERAQFLIAVDPIDQALTRTTDADEIGQLTTQRLLLMQSLETSIAPIESQIDLLDRELAGLRLIENFLDDTELSARVNRTAQVPTSPFAPSLPLNVAIGIVLGVLVGAGLVMLREATDDRLRSADEFSARSGLTPLTTVGHVRRDKGSPNIEPRSQTAESFQRLSSALEFSGARGIEHKVVMFTSARPAESKTTTIARLGVTLAREGKRTLLIGADLRRPTLAKKFGAASGPGLADILSGSRNFDECVCQMPGITELHILRAGTLDDATNPVDLLRSAKMESLLEDLRTRYDQILVDCPPVLPVVDALEISTVCDAIVFNVFARRSRNRSVIKSLSLIAQSTTTPVVGFVLTGAKRREDDYSANYDYYGTPPLSSTHVDSPAPVPTSAPVPAHGDQDQDQDQGEASIVDLDTASVVPVDSAPTPEYTGIHTSGLPTSSGETASWGTWRPVLPEADVGDQGSRADDPGFLQQIAIRNRATTVAAAIKGLSDKPTKGTDQ